MAGRRRVPAQVVRSGQASTKLRDAVLAFYGTVCWLQLPGCTRLATTKDHVIPVDHGGTDAMENLRPACLSCNSKRRNLAISGIGGIIVRVLVGPIAERLSAHAVTNARPGDVIVDVARLRDALTVPGVGTPPRHIEHLAARAYRSAMDQALRMAAQCGVWIVHPVPTAKQLQQYARLRYEILTIDPGRTPADLAAIGDLAQAREVANWYKHYPEGPASIERVKAHRNFTALAAAAPPDSTARAPSRRW